MSEMDHPRRRVFRAADPKLEMKVGQFLKNAPAFATHVPTPAALQSWTAARRNAELVLRSPAFRTVQQVVPQIRTMNKQVALGRQLDKLAKRTVLPRTVPPTFTLPSSPEARTAGLTARLDRRVEQMADEMWKRQDERDAAWQSRLDEERAARQAADERARQADARAARSFRLSVISYITMTVLSGLGIAAGFIVAIWFRTP